MSYRCFYILLLLYILIPISVQAHSVQNQETTTNSLASGKYLFNKKCAVCHGNEGAGGVGVPLNLNDFLSTTSDRYLYQTIKLGRPGRVMPAFSTFSKKQIQSIIHYIRSWKPKIKVPVYAINVIEKKASVEWERVSPFQDPEMQT